MSTSTSLSRATVSWWWPLVPGLNTDVFGQAKSAERKSRSREKALSKLTR